MQTPVVTVLMPVKDYHEGHLREAVRSLLDQTSRDWRALVIGERSNHGELQRVLAEPLADARIELVVNEGRKLAGAFNTGMRTAGTPFVATLLGDDLWAPDAVEVLAGAIAASPRSDFLHSARRIVDGEGRPLSSIHPSRPDVALADFAGGSSPVKHLLCWRRELGLAIGGMDESLNSVGVDDFDFPWSMAEAGAAFTAIPECLYVYRDHRDAFRLTTHLPRSHHRREIVRIMRKHGVAGAKAERFAERAEQSYLRQCLYRSRFDRAVKRLRRHAASNGWRDSYR
jgi:glycosyltransferase involved in cell wall biosynthesis